MNTGNYIGKYKTVKMIFLFVTFVYSVLNAYGNNYKSGLMGIQYIKILIYTILTAKRSGKRMQLYRSKFYSFY